MATEGAQLSLGEFLRQERERRGITIEQVASATKIGVKTLHQLEADEYAELPAKPFVRGFVNSYCRFIGLDSKEILIRFGAFIDARALNRPNREGGHSGYAFEKREGEQSRTILWIVMGSFVVVGGLAAAFIKKPLGHHRHGSHAEKLNANYSVAPSPSPILSPSPVASASPAVMESPVVSVAAVLSPSPVSSPMVSITPQESPQAAPHAVETPHVAQAPSPAPEPAPAHSPVEAVASTPLDEGPSPEDPLNSGIKLKPSEIKHRVVFKAVESAWVRYQCDHRPVTVFVIRAGKALVLRARESIKFQVSPSKAITFSYKGSGFKPVLGDSHLVTRQGDATLFFPFELATSVEASFPNEKPLSGREVPAPRVTPSASPSVTPESP